MDTKYAQPEGRKVNGYVIGEHVAPEVAMARLQTAERALAMATEALVECPRTYVPPSVFEKLHEVTTKVQDSQRQARSDRLERDRERVYVGGNLYRA